MRKEKVIFTKISPNEVKFSFMGYKFVLIEKSRGVYGIGKSVCLYKLDGFDKKLLKEIGWTKSDNHSGYDSSTYLQRYVTFEECQQPALDYIESILK